MTQFERVVLRNLHIFHNCGMCRGCLTALLGGESCPHAISQKTVRQHVNSGSCQGTSVSYGGWWS